MTPPREYVAEASCLAVWFGQTTAQFSVAYLGTMVPLGIFVCQRAQASPFGHELPFTHMYTQCDQNLAFAIRKCTKT